MPIHGEWNVCKSFKQRTRQTNASWLGNRLDLDSVCRMWWTQHQPTTYFGTWTSQKIGSRSPSLNANPIPYNSNNDPSLTLTAKHHRESFVQCSSTQKNSKQWSWYASYWMVAIGNCFRLIPPKRTKGRILECSLQDPFPGSLRFPRRFTSLLLASSVVSLASYSPEDDDSHSSIQDMDDWIVKG